MAKILIVDDSALQRKAIESDLKSLKELEILTANNGEEALHTIVEERPDCILTDLLMPIMGGLEFIKRLRSDQIDIPVIVITSNSSQTKLQEVEQLGVVTILNKPYEEQELINKVKEVLGG